MEQRPIDYQGHRVSLPHYSSAWLLNFMTQPRATFCRCRRVVRWNSLRRRP